MEEILFYPWLGKKIIIKKGKRDYKAFDLEVIEKRCEHVAWEIKYADLIE